MTHVQRDRQLSKPVMPPINCPPRSHIAGRQRHVFSLEQPLPRKIVVELLRECVHLREVNRKLSDSLWEEPLERTSDAPELFVTAGEIVLAVQLRKKEAKCHSRIGHPPEVCISASKPPRLQAFNHAYRIGLAVNQGPQAH